MTRRATRAERRAAAVAKPAQAKAGHAVNDSFQNVAARLGIGTQNIGSGAKYAFNPITRARQDLDFMYRGSWLVGRVVDCVAEDMTRAGIDIRTDSDPSVIDQIHKHMKRLQVWQALTDTIKWSRLYGGAVALIMIEGQDVSTPLRHETVGQGQFKGLYPLDRWVVQPTYSKLVQDLGPDMGKPAGYQVVVDLPPFTGKTIHHSRILRFDGVALPYWQRVSEQGWGMSVIERLYDRLVAFDSTTQGAAQLVFKAHLRTVSVENLRDILSAGGPAEAALIKQFEMIRLMQSTEGLTLIDSKDTFQTFSYTFAGLSDVLMQFAQQLSGASEIPLVRLFGQSPAGLNATGESDVRSYYDLIAQQQESRLRHPIEVIVELVYRSEISETVPDDLHVEFNSLWQMSEKERAEIVVGVTSAIVQAEQAGIVPTHIALKELRQSSDVTGVWSNITDEDIAAAEAKPPIPEFEPPDPLNLGSGGADVETEKPVLPV